MFRIILPAVALCLLLPPQVQAQANDMAYCAELSNMYRRYLGTGGAGRHFSDIPASTAIEQCEKGNTAAGIPVLEKKLGDARFTLPKRS